MRGLGMATQSTTTTPPSPADGNPQEDSSSPPPAVKPVEGDAQDSKEDAASESFKRSISAGLEPMREEQVQNAVKFLSHPKVRGSPVIYRRSFLEKKGLTKEEIDEAFHRVPDPPSNATSVETANASQAAIPQKPSTSLQPHAPAQTLQHAVVPTNAVSMAPTLQQSRFQWPQVLLAIGVLTASGAGTAVLFKKAVLPRLKSWIRKVVNEEDDAEKKDKSKPSLAEEAAEAAKAAASAAAIVAKASQDLLSAKSEEKKYFEVFMGLLDAQTKEMKSMGNAIRSLEVTREDALTQDKQIEEHIWSTSENGSINKTRVNAHFNQSDSRLSYMTPELGKVNGKPDVDFGAVRPLSTPVSVDPTAIPYPKSFTEIMAMVQRGETPPGIKEINDMPPNPNQQPTNPRLAPRVKPWEVAAQVNHTSLTYGLQSQVRADGSSSEVQEDGYYSQGSGKSADDSDPLWKQKSVKATKIDSEKEGLGVSSYGIGSHNWPGRDWVPPQTPSVFIPEAAAAIRQPKTSVPRQQEVNEQSSVQPANGEDDGTGRAPDSAIQAESSGGVFTNHNQNEMLEVGIDGVEVS